MSMTHPRPARRRLLALLLATLSLLLVVAPAHAARPQVVALHSTSGASTVDDQGTAHLAGTIAGSPYDGAYTAQLYSYDGSLPTDGLCEPGWAFLQVAGPRDAALELAVTGSVCDRWGPVRIVGQFEVVHATKRRHLGVVGWFGMTVTETGGGWVEAYDWT